jgi:hypothetical protein
MVGDTRRGAFFGPTFTAYEYAPPQLKKKRRPLWDRRKDGESRKSLRFYIRHVMVELNGLKKSIFGYRRKNDTLALIR